MTKLDQHFLKSPAIARRVAAAAETNPEDTVLEIGPGKGILTTQLLQSAGKVVAVEADKELFNRLHEKFKGDIESGKLELLNKDILEMSPEEHPSLKVGYKLVSNIPYSITGSILRKFLEATYQPKKIVVLVQKEVAENITNLEKESLISLSVKAYGNPQYIQTVKKDSFSPPPKVNSAILKISNISRSFFENIKEEEFFRVVRTGFSQPRKKALGNLSALENKAELKRIFEETGISANKRPENIELSEWKQIVKKIEN